MRIRDKKGNAKFPYFQINSKRGDIPITILVIGVLAVCTLALLSFFFSTIKVKNSFTGVSKMEELNADVELAGGNVDKEVSICEKRWQFSWNPFNLRKKYLVFAARYCPEGVSCTPTSSC